MTVTVNINGLEAVTEAVNSLARALGSSGVAAALADRAGSGSPGAQQAPVQVPAAVPPQIPAGGYPGTVPVSPMPQAGQPAGQGMPGFQAQSGTVPPAAGQVPVTAVPQAYTQDQMAVAMTGLVDQGKQPQVMQVLAGFGASSLVQVPKEQYPALATQLRMLGANL